jgi:hypothetical protein
MHPTAVTVVAVTVVAVILGWERHSEPHGMRGGRRRAMRGTIRYRTLHCLQCIQLLLQLGHFPTHVVKFLFSLLALLFGKEFGLILHVRRQHGWRALVGGATARPPACLPRPACLHQLGERFEASLSFQRICELRLEFLGALPSCDFGLWARTERHHHQEAGVSNRQLLV